MTKPEYLQYHRECCEKMMKITEAKNSDYTGNSSSPFANFVKCENDGACTTEQGFYVRMSDKMSRISSFIQKGVLEVKDESIEDTCQDLCNYLILFMGYVKTKKENDTLQNNSNKFPHHFMKEEE